MASNTTERTEVAPSPTAGARPPGRLYRRLQRTVADAGLADGTIGRVVTEADVADVPEPARRYLRFMGVIGKPRDWSFQVRFQGNFRMKPGAPWMPADAWQYNSSVETARIFVMRLLIGHLVPFQGTDTYVRGYGHMVGTLLGRKVIDGRGDEFDHSELVIYLNDALLLAPSMLLTPSVSWIEAGEDAFEVALTDHGRTVSGRSRVDERGALVDFVADRYATLPEGLVLAPWRTPISGWTTVNGRPIPGQAEVTYDLAGGPYCYIKGRFAPDSLAHNVPSLGL